MPTLDKIYRCTKCLMFFYQLQLYKKHVERNDCKPLPENEDDDDDEPNKLEKSIKSGEDDKLQECGHCGVVVCNLNWARIHIAGHLKTEKEEHKTKNNVQ